MSWIFLVDKQEHLLLKASSWGLTCASSLCNSRGLWPDKRSPEAFAHTTLEDPPPHCQWRRCMLDLFLSLIHCPPPNCPSVLDFAPVTEGEMLGVSSSPGNENYRRQEQEWMAVEATAGGIFVVVTCTVSGARSDRERRSRGSEASSLLSLPVPCWGY